MKLALRSRVKHSTNEPLRSLFFVNVKVKTDDLHPQVNILNMVKLILMGMVKTNLKLN